jgi:hypothetical protein
MLLSYLNMGTNEDLGRQLFFTYLTFLLLSGVAVENTRDRLQKFTLQEVITFKCVHCQGECNKKTSVA